MRVDELKALATSWWGERGWQSRLADRLGVERSTVTRWLQTGMIPGPVVAALRCWAAHGGPPDGPPE